MVHKFSSKCIGLLRVQLYTRVFVGSYLMVSDKSTLRKYFILKKHINKMTQLK